MKITITLDTDNSKSVDEASKLIDGLKTQTNDKPMTKRQADFLRSLCVSAGRKFTPNLTKDEASKLIDELKDIIDYDDDDDDDDDDDGYSIIIDTKTSFNTGDF